MGSKNTFMRGLFLVCLATVPAVMACEGVLEFDRSLIQHYASDDGSAANQQDSGGMTDEDSGMEDDASMGPMDSGNSDTGAPSDAGRDGDTGT